MNATQVREKVYACDAAKPVAVNTSAARCQSEKQSRAQGTCVVSAKVSDHQPRRKTQEPIIVMCGRAMENMRQKLL